MSGHQTATINDTVYFWFASNDTSGSGDDGASAVYDVREAGAAADAIPLLSGSATLLSHANYPAGCYEVAVAATTGNGFAADDTFAVFCTLAVDSQNPSGLVGSCTLTPLAKAAALQVVDDEVAVIAGDVVNIDGIVPAAAGDAMTLAAGAVTNASLAGNMEIVFETDFATNYNTTRNAWVSNYTDIIGTMDAAAFGADFLTSAKIADGAFVAANFAASSLDGKGNWNIGKTGYALTTADWNVGKTGYSLTATTGLGAQTANITGNLSGSVGSVSGSVGSVTGHTNQSGDTFALANGGTGFVAIDTVVDGIKTATDKLTFTVANQVDANIQYINDAAVTGDGSAIPWDGA